jgi:hypothetical protein
MGFARGLQSGMDMGARMISIRDHATKAEEERKLREELAAAGTGAATDRDRQLAIAGVLEKYGQVERGLNIRNAADQRDALAEDRAHQRTLRPLQVSAAQRSDRAGAQAEADDATVRATDTEVAGFLDQRITNPDGTKRSVTPDDHVQATLYRAGALQRAGKTEKAAEAMKNYQAAAMGKIAMENTERAEAARVAMAGVRQRKFDAFTKFFDTYIPDGSRVVNIKELGGDKVEITREANGKRLKPDVSTVDEMVVGIEAAVDPKAAWQMTMQLADRAMRERGEARADRAEGRAASAHAAGAPAREVAGMLAQQQKTLLDPKAAPDARQAAATALQEYQMMGGKRGGDRPAQVQLAGAIVRAGLRPDMKSALEFAMTSKDKSPEAMRAEIYKTALTASFGNASRAMAATDEAMKYLQPAAAPAAAPANESDAHTQAQSAVAKGGAPAAAPANESDAHTQAQSAVAKGANKDVVNARLRRMGFSPLP